MAIFLTAKQAYRVIQRELPEGAYPDGSPSGFYSTASTYSKAKVIESLYTNLQRIYLNMFPQSADEKQLDWEIKAFGYYLDPSMSLEDRQKAVVNKLRQHPGINRQAMEDIVRTIIGGDITFLIINWNCADNITVNGTGVWILDESQLDIDTYLGGARMSDVTPSLFPGYSLCENDPAFGKTDEEWEAMQEQAYTFEVLIFGYTLTAQQRLDMDAALSRGEPARSAHVITDGLDPNDLPSGGS